MLEISSFLSRLLGCSLEIRAVWSIGHDIDGEAAAPAQPTLLVFADGATLERMRRSPQLHGKDIDVMVVTDGDRYEVACGPHRCNGSLGRSAWRQDSPGEAFYEDSEWGAGGAVVRVRRKAIRMWHTP